MSRIIEIPKVALPNVFIENRKLLLSAARNALGPKSPGLAMMALQRRSMFPPFRDSGELPDRSHQKRRKENHAPDHASCAAEMSRKNAREIANFHRNSTILLQVATHHATANAYHVKSAFLSAISGIRRGRNPCQSVKNRSKQHCKRKTNEVWIIFLTTQQIFSIFDKDLNRPLSGWELICPQPMVR